MGASKIARDITERKMVERSNLESMGRLRAMFNQAGVGVCLISPDGRLMEMNPKFCNILGYSESELKGRTCAELTYEEDRAASQRALDELASTPKETGSFEIRYIRKNTLPVWVRVTVAKILDQEGSLKQYVAIVEDFSEYKRAEEGVKESENRFRILAENIQSLAWMANADGWIFWCNQRWYEYLGASFESIKGWGWENTIHPDHAESVHDFLKTAWAKGEPWEITFPLKSKHGDYRRFLTNAFPVRDHYGQVQRWIGTCTNIDELQAKA